MNNIKDTTFVGPSQPKTILPTKEEQTHLAAEQKIQRLMLRFQATPEKLEQLRQDFECMENQILNPKIEKFLAKYLKEQWPVTDSALKPLKTKDPLCELKTNTRSQLIDFFNLLKSTSTQKTLVIANETDGLNQRKIPEVKISSRKNRTSTTPLLLI